MRFITILFIILTACTGLIAQTAIAPAAGDGSEASPYEITNLENLYWITADNDIVPNPDQEARFSSHYIQTADIDASETTNWFDGQGWSPIGHYVDLLDYQSFTGSYDGQNYSIDALYFNRPFNASSGLFGYTLGATIENLVLTNVDTNGGQGIGGLVGWLENSVINNSYSTGIVNGFMAVGGLAGRQSDSIINNSNSAVSVSGEAAVGGLVGVQSNSMISNSFSTGSVTGFHSLGGLVGANGSNSVISNSYYNYEEVLINGQNTITIGALDSQTYNTWFNNDLHLNIDDHLSFNGDSYLINSVSDLRKLLAFCQFEEYSFKLTTNLSLENHTDFFIPYFSGSFDGYGFEIDNLTLETDFNDYNGLFGYALGATIENLGVTNVDITGGSYNGGICGRLDNSVIKNCYSTGNVSGYLYIGGLVGYQENESISNSNSTVVVSGNSDVGGILGHLKNGSISNCCSTGNVSGHVVVGGLVGRNTGSTISNCYSTGDVTATASIVGGLVGRLSGATVTNCYSTGHVSGDRDVGGLVGMLQNSSVNSSYWNTETSGQMSSDGGSGRTTAEMTYPYAEDTYFDWIFPDIWVADEDYTINNGYPFLREMPVSVEEEEQTSPAASLSLSNFPNPFNPETTISFYLPQDMEHLSLTIYNIRGQLVRTLVERIPHPKGVYQVVWDGKNDFGRPVTSGVYFYRLKTPDLDQVNKMLLLK